MEQECVRGVIDWRTMYRGRLAGMRTISAWSELLDNALDAMGNTTSLELHPRRFVIEDDGKGAASLDPFFGFGVHREHEGGRGRDALGRWGVGGTHALLWISQELETRVSISTRCKGARRSIDISWHDLAAIFNRGDGAPSHFEKSPGRSGCRIELTGNIRVPNAGAEFDKLLDDLGFRYSKAIEGGAKIIVKRHVRGGASKTLVLEPFAPPALLSVVEDTFEIKGKRVRLMAGMLPPGSSYDRIGLHYRFNYRVIVESSRDGCEPYATSRIFGYVDLLDGWRLDLHKEGITDPDAKLLYAEVFRRMEPLLKAAQHQLMVVESQALTLEVEKRLNDAIEKASKAKRGRGAKHGTTRPTGKGAGHGDAQSKQPGDKMGADGGAQRPRVHVEFADLKVSGIGELRAGTIRLNTSLEYMRRIRDTSNVDASFGHAMWIYGNSKASNGSLDSKRFDEVGEFVGRAVAPNAQPAVNGKKLTAA